MNYVENTPTDFGANLKRRGIVVYRIALTTIFGILFCASSANAHEYYLMPESFQPAAGKEFSVRHRLGQKFKGNEMPFIGAWNIRSEVWQDGEMREIKGLDGDRPALKITTAKPGLISVIHQSNIDFLTFKTWEKFEKYTVKEGLEHTHAASENGTKPKIDLKEAYARYAKTLISVGENNEGRDTPTGLKIELVALAHPASLTAGQKMPVQLLYDGKPLKGALLKVFVGIDTEFKHQIRTDAEGKVEIPADGAGPYLLNAIHMTEPQSQEAVKRGAHWESFWASLTFNRNQ